MRIEGAGFRGAGFRGSRFRVQGSGSGFEARDLEKALGAAHGQDVLHLRDVSHSNPRDFLHTSLRDFLHTDNNSKIHACEPAQLFKFEG